MFDQIVIFVSNNSQFVTWLHKYVITSQIKSQEVIECNIEYLCFYLSGLYNIYIQLPFGPQPLLQTHIQHVLQETLATCCSSFQTFYFYSHSLALLHDMAYLSTPNVCIFKMLPPPKSFTNIPRHGSNPLSHFPKHLSSFFSIFVLLALYY